MRYKPFQQRPEVSKEPLRGEVLEWKSKFGRGLCLSLSLSACQLVYLAKTR